MALKKADDTKDEKDVTKEPVVKETAKDEVVKEAVVQETQTTAPSTTVEPTEPAAPAVVPKTEKELEDEKRVADEFAQKRLDDEAAAREQAGKPPVKRLELVPVENLRPTDFFQASTGKWIKGGATENLLDDGWLENHVKAKLLKRL